MSQRLNHNFSPMDTDSVALKNAASCPPGVLAEIRGLKAREWGCDCHRTFWLAGGVILLLAALALRVFMMNSSLANIPVTSDEAITVLQAKRITEGERPLLFYAQPYLFPMESYLAAPLVKLVPRTTAGARYVIFVEGFLTLLLLLAFARKVGPIRDTWPMVLLILFPSAYLLMIQFGYSLPHNSSAYLACLLAILLNLRQPAEKWRIVSRVLTGLLCGLAFTNHMMALTFAAPILVVAALRSGWRRIFTNSLFLGIGLCLGLIPYWAAMIQFPRAHQLVSGTRPIEQAFSVFWDPLLTFSLPRTLGISPPLFSDVNKFLPFGQLWIPVVPYIFCLILLAATFVRVRHLFREWRRTRQLLPELQDIFLGAAWLTLVLFSISSRASPGSFRYLTPAILGFPFLVGSIYAIASRPWRCLIGLGCVLIVFLNAVTTVKLANQWKTPSFATDVMDTPDLTPTIEFLRQRGITHCKASQWQAYRINFITDEAIICSQPYNERFPNWPLPYKEVVDNSTNIAYALTDQSNPDMRPQAFENHLKEAHISAEKQRCGTFSVYYGFHLNPPFANDVRVPWEETFVSVSHNSAAAQCLVDGNRKTRWTTNRLQDSGMWIEIGTRQARWLSKVVLFHERFFRDRARRMTVKAQTPEGWRVVATNTLGQLDMVELRNYQPIYQPNRQTICFDPVYTDRLRIEISEPDPRYSWTFMLVELYQWAGQIE